MDSSGLVEIKGIGASEGVASGRAFVARSVNELGGISSGDILIVEHSNPAWTLGMLKASGIVAEAGGIICHAALVAREMGIPCVVAADGAMSQIPTGTMIQIDGTRGEIREAK